MPMWLKTFSKLIQSCSLHNPIHDDDYDQVRPVQSLGLLFSDAPSPLTDLHKANGCCAVVVTAGSGSSLELVPVSRLHSILLLHFSWTGVLFQRSDDLTVRVSRRESGFPMPFRQEQCVRLSCLSDIAALRCHMQRAKPATHNLERCATPMFM